MRKCVLAWIVASAVTINPFSFIHSVQAANTEVLVGAEKLESKILEIDKLEARTTTASIPDSDNSSITFDKTEVFVGETIIVTLELRDNNNDPVLGVTPIITVEGKVLSLSSEELKELGEGKYVFSFTPTEAGQQYLAFSVNNIPVKNKFFTVKDYDGRITVTKDGQEIQTAMVGDEIELTLELTKKDGIQPPNIKVKVPGVNSQVILQGDSKGTYREKAKVGTIESGFIAVEDITFPNIKQVPFSVVERTDGSTSEGSIPEGSTPEGSAPEGATTEEITGKIMVMKDAQPIVDILAKDEMQIIVELTSTEVLPDEINITVPGVEGDVVLKKDMKDGLYKGNIAPTKPAVGNITLKDSRFESIQPVPITVYVGEISTENSNFAFEADSIKVGENISGKLKLQDKNGNGIANKQPRITFDGNEIESKEVEEEIGSYMFSFTPQAEGNKVLTAEVDGKEIIKYTIQVIPPSFPNRGNHSIPLIESVESNQVEDWKENKIDTEKTLEDGKKIEDIKESGFIVSHKTSSGKKQKLDNAKEVVSIAQGIANDQPKDKQKNRYLIGKEEMDDKGSGKQESCDTGIVYGNYFVGSTIPKTGETSIWEKFSILVGSAAVMILQLRRRKQR